MGKESTKPDKGKALFLVFHIPKGFTIDEGQNSCQTTEFKQFI